MRPQRPLPLALAVLVGGALLAGGCHGTYRTQAVQSMPGTAVATLRGEGENHIVWVMDCDLLAVDGERLGLLDDRAEVLPGRHTAWVQLWQDDVVNNRSSYLYCAVELEVQGGRDYRLRATQLGPSVSILSGDGIVESVSPLAVDCRETLIELELTQKGILYGH